MRELIRHEEKSNGLETSLEGQFTPEEILVIKSILGIKAIHGVASRLYKPQEDFHRQGNGEMVTYIGEARESLKQLARGIRDLVREYALGLGISEKRFYEIDEYVYTHERKL